MLKMALKSGNLEIFLKTSILWLLPQRSSENGVVIFQKSSSTHLSSLFFGKNSVQRKILTSFAHSELNSPYSAMINNNNEISEYKITFDASTLRMQNDRKEKKATIFYSFVLYNHFIYCLVC